MRRYFLSLLTALALCALMRSVRQRLLRMRRRSVGSIALGLPTLDVSVSTAGSKVFPIPSRRADISSA